VQLNIIDCAAYALAKTRDLPLLFKGNDFAATDIRPALPFQP
jgi:ribonuclease VapC